MVYIESLPFLVTLFYFGLAELEFVLLSIVWKRVGFVWTTFEAQPWNQEEWLVLARHEHLE